VSASEGLNLATLSMFDPNGWFGSQVETWTQEQQAIIVSYLVRPILPPVWFSKVRPRKV
jgi:hypothetical protein